MKKRLMGLFIGAWVVAGAAVAEESTTLVAKGIGRSWSEVYKFTDPDTGAVCYVAITTYNTSSVPAISCVRTDQRL